MTQHQDQPDSREGVGPWLDELEKVALAAADDAPGPWYGTERGAYVCLNPADITKGRDDSGVWLATGDTSDITDHIAAFDPPTVLKLIALARSGEAG